MISELLIAGTGVAAGALVIYRVAAAGRVYLEEGGGLL